jgi:hypothetical protein
LGRDSARVMGPVRFPAAVACRPELEGAARSPVDLIAARVWLPRRRFLH